MEPWQGGWAPWCVGSVFAAPQLLTAASSLPCENIEVGPLLFNAVGKPQRLLSAGCPRLPPDDSNVEISVQTQEVPSSSADAVLPTEMLEDHSKEDNGSRFAVITHSPQFLGNRLQSLQTGRGRFGRKQPQIFIHVRVWQCRDGEYVMFFPTGEKADRIGSASCFKDEHKRWHLSNVPTNDSTELAQRSGPTSDSLRSPILQLSAVRKNVWDIDSESLIAARCSYMVQFVAARKEGGETLFTAPIVASFEKLVSHVAWNQHLPSDAAVILESGEVRIFDVQHAGFSHQLNPLQLNAKGLYKIPRQDPPVSLSTNPIQRTKKKLRIAMKERKPPTKVEGPPFKWWRCEFAWHPKILLVAGSKEVSLMDFRVKFTGAYAQLGPLPKESGDVAQDCHTSVVARLPGCANSAGYGNRPSVDDAFSSFARADHDGMYQFATTTRRHIMLFDTRRPHTPLLQWTHGMDSEPPNLLSMCSLSALRQQPSASTSVTGNVILAATYQSGDIRAFCYGAHPTASFPLQSSLAATAKPSELDETLYAWRLPSKVSPPYAGPSYWSDVLSSEMNFFQQEDARRKSHVKERPKENIMGLVVLSNDSNVNNLGTLQKKEDDARGFSLMQLTGLGDILVQQSQAVEKLEHSEHSQHAQKFQAPVSQICEPTTSESKREERKRRKRKKYTVKKLSHFSNYFKTGAALPGHADVSILNTSTPKRPKFAPETQYDTSKGPKKDPAVQKADVLQRWIQHLDDQKLKVLIAETVKQSNVPLSVYEIAHKVLRRTLPRDFAILAAGMPADAFYLRYRNYLATLVADQLLQNFVMKDEGQKDVKTECTSEIHKGPSIQNLEASAIPLPFLLERLSRYLEQTSTENKDLGDDIGGKQHMEVRDSELEGEAEVPRVESASATSHEMLQSGYEQVGRLVDHLVEEGRSKGRIRDVSLADTVESWQDTPAEVQLSLMQYRISQKELPVTSGQRNLFLGAHPSPSATIHETETIGSRSHKSVLERDVFCTFVGCVRNLEPSDTSPVGSQQVLYEMDLCPINLPFHTSSKVCQPEISTALSSLQTQLKQWLQKLVPYQTFCRDKLENVGS